MPEKRHYREKREYFVEGTTARLAYRQDSGSRNSRISNENRYTYKNSRGQEVRVPHSYAREGLARRKLEEDYYDYAPARETQPLREERLREKPVSQPLKRVDFTTLLVLCLVLTALGYACYSYLSVQSDISAFKSEIASVEQQIASIKNENAERLSQVETNVDLKKIYRIATKELGMVHPKKEQVITYQSKQSGTVKQYGDIPEKSKSVIEKILE